MLKVNTNINTEKLENTTAEFVGVWFNNYNYPYIVAFGNDPKEVREETYFHWAVIADYNGRIEVLPIAEVEW